MGLRTMTIANVKVKYPNDYAEKNYRPRSRARVLRVQGIFRLNVQS